MPVGSPTPEIVAAAGALAIESILAARRKLDEVSPYIDRPAEWITARLKEFVWSKQREIAESIAVNRRTAVPSAHEMGKSWLASRIVAWWLDVHAPGEAFVVTTAPTAPQVRAILWREINRAHRKGNLLGRTNQTEWWINDELVAFGRKPSDYDPAAFQGIRARYVLIVLDEACGIPESIWVAAQSLAANEHSRMLAIGNPDDPQSHFATVCSPDSGWHVIHVDGMDSPNFTGEEIPESLHDLLMSPIYEQEMRADYGEDHPFYVSKVRGRFPDDNPDGLIPLSAIRACQIERTWESMQLLPVEIGFDVGAGGDQAVLRERRGVKTGRVERYRTSDSSVLVGHAVRFIQDTGATSIKVDVIGVGWAVAGRLAELYDQGVHGAQVVKVNVGESSTEPSRFPKLRDQLWWQCGRDLIRQQAVDLSDMDEATVAQLIAPTWKPDSAGRAKVEPKDETKKRLKRSPDDADAWLLAYYEDGGVGIWMA